MTVKGDPFAVNEERALDALSLAWADEYDQIWVHDGEWGAHHKDAPDGDVITGSTPDELNRGIRADWARRENAGAV
jgi:GMP synthase-like glutamine amidotransferase